MIHCNNRNLGKENGSSIEEILRDNQEPEIVIPSTNVPTLGSDEEPNERDLVKQQIAAREERESMSFRIMRSPEQKAAHRALFEDIDSFSGLVDKAIEAKMNEAQMMEIITPALDAQDAGIKRGLDASIKLLDLIPEDRVKEVLINFIKELRAKDLDSDVIDLALFKSVMKMQLAINDETIDAVNAMLKSQEYKNIVEKTNPSSPSRRKGGR